MRKPIPAALRLALRYLPDDFHAALAAGTVHVLTADLGLRCGWSVADPAAGQVFLVNASLLDGDAIVRDALRMLVQEWRNRRDDEMPAAA